MLSQYVVVVIYTQAGKRKKQVMTPTTANKTRLNRNTVPQSETVPKAPTSRELRIMRNLVARNPIWEAVGRDYFTQFDEITGNETRIPSLKLKEMETAGWIQLIQPPRAAQRLDRYEITTLGASLAPSALKKSPQRELETTVLTRRRRRG